MSQTLSDILPLEGLQGAGTGPLYRKLRQTSTLR